MQLSVVEAQLCRLRPSAHTMGQMVAPLGTEPPAWVLHVQLPQCPRGLPICAAHSTLPRSGPCSVHLLQSLGGHWLAERASFIWSSLYPLLFLSFLFAQGSSSLPPYPHVSTLWPPPQQRVSFPLALFLLPRCQMPSVLREVVVAAGEGGA